MAARIIQINQADDLQRKCENEGCFKLSQKRSGSVASLKEGDIVFVFQSENDISDGEVRYKCVVTKVGEIADDGDICTTLILDKKYGSGICSFADLRGRGFVRNRFFHWNIVPELAKYIEDKAITGGVKSKNAVKKSKAKTVEKKEKKAMAKDDKKKDDKKKDVKKDSKKKDDNKKDKKKDDKKKVVKKDAKKNDKKKK